jgi:hypothetical protein
LIVNGSQVDDGVALWSEAVAAAVNA